MNRQRSYHLFSSLLLVTALSSPLYSNDQHFEGLITSHTKKTNRPFLSEYGDYWREIFNLPNTELSKSRIKEKGYSDFFKVFQSKHMDFSDFTDFHAKDLENWIQLRFFGETPIKHKSLENKLASEFLQFDPRMHTLYYLFSYSTKYPIVIPKYYMKNNVHFEKLDHQENLASSKEFFMTFILPIVDRNIENKLYKNSLPYFLEQYGYDAKDFMDEKTPKRSKSKTSFLDTFRGPPKKTGDEKQNKPQKTTSGDVEVKFADEKNGSQEEGRKRSMSDPEIVVKEKESPEDTKVEAPSFQATQFMYDSLESKQKLFVNLPINGSQWYEIFDISDKEACIQEFKNQGYLSLLNKMALNSSISTTNLAEAQKFSLNEWLSRHYFDKSPLKHSNIENKLSSAFLQFDARMHVIIYRSREPSKYLESFKEHFENSSVSFDNLNDESNAKQSKKFFHNYIKKIVEADKYDLTKFLEKYGYVAEDFLDKVAEQEAPVKKGFLFSLFGRGNKGKKEAPKGDISQLASSSGTLEIKRVETSPSEPSTPITRQRSFSDPLQPTTVQPLTAEQSPKAESPLPKAKESFPKIQPNLDPNNIQILSASTPKPTVPQRPRGQTGSNSKFGFKSHGLDTKFKASLETLRKTIPAKLVFEIETAYGQSTKFEDFTDKVNSHKKLYPASIQAIDAFMATMEKANNT